MVLQTLARTAYDEDHHAFRDQVRRFFERELTPNLQRWEDEGIVDRAFWNTCGEAGLLCPTVPEAHGGLGLDFGYNCIVDEEMSYNGVPAGFSLQSDIVVGYLERGPETWRLSFTRSA